MTAPQTSGRARAAWNPQMPGSARKGVPGRKEGEADLPGANPRCEYADCDRRRVWESDGWLFCGTHYLEHRSLFHGRRWPHRFGKKDPASYALDLKPCGTEPAIKRHRRNGDPDCHVCIAAAEVRKTESSARGAETRRRVA